jgi:SOS response regulatory protein OraA/RecX
VTIRLAKNDWAAAWRAMIEVALFASSPPIPSTKCSQPIWRRLAARGFSYEVVNRPAGSSIMAKPSV